MKNKKKIEGAEILLFLAVAIMTVGCGPDFGKLANNNATVPQNGGFTQAPTNNTGPIYQPSGTQQTNIPLPQPRPTGEFVPRLTANEELKGTSAEMARAGMVNLADGIPGAVYDAKYANFNGSKKAYLALPAARGLKAVQRDLSAMNPPLSMKIFDGYRPLSTQKKLWKENPNPRYVANPYKNGSRHNRGYAVDLTLVDQRTGRELDMGTGFDEFTPRAATNYANLTTTQKRNRQILHSAMKKHGFTPISSEWWHFDYPGWQGKKALDIPIS